MEAREHSLTVIVNLSAGSAHSRTAEQVSAALSTQGRSARIRVVPAADIPEVAREASRGEGLVGVAGGDGTLSSAAGAIAEAGGVLVPIPLGTRNHFARRLGIDSVEAAARAVASGPLLRVPLGTVNGRVFINHASAGLYPRIVHHRERIRRWTGKPTAQMLAGMYAVARLPLMTVGLQLDGVRCERTVPGLWVALGRGAFRLPVDGHAPGGRSLEVILPHVRSSAGVVRAAARVWWRLRRGLPLEPAGIEVIHTPVFTLEARHPVDLSRDGEVERDNSPIEFRIHPRALRVLSLVSADETSAVA